MPDAAARSSMIAQRLKSVPLSPDINIEAVVSATEGMTGADITELCHRAVLCLVRRDIERECTAANLASSPPELSNSSMATADTCRTAGLSGSADDVLAVHISLQVSDAVLTAEDIEAAMACARWSVPPEEVERYNRLEEQLKTGSLQSKQVCWLHHSTSHSFAVLYGAQYPIDHSTSGLFLSLWSLSRWTISCDQYSANMWFKAADFVVTSYLGMVVVRKCPGVR